MKTGVSIVPWLRCSRPRRARVLESLLRTSNFMQASEPESRHRRLAVFAMNPAESIGNLANACLGDNRIHDVRHQVFVPSRGVFELSQTFRDGLGVALLTDLLKLLDLSTFEVRIVGVERNGFFLVDMESIDANDDSFPGFDGSLILKGGVLNLALDPSRFDRGQHPPQAIDSRQAFEGLALHFICRLF